jgi:hypothetical protein
MRTVAGKYNKVRPRVKGRKRLLTAVFTINLGLSSKC